LRWTEWAGPAGLDEQLAYLDEHTHHDDQSPPIAEYRGLLAQAGPMSTEHEVLVTVTVDALDAAGPAGGAAPAPGVRDQVAAAPIASSGGPLRGPEGRVSTV
jgi:hypothetical protein